MSEDKAAEKFIEKSQNLLVGRKGLIHRLESFVESIKEKRGNTSKESCLTPDALLKVFAAMYLRQVIVSAAENTLSETLMYLKSDLIYDTPKDQWLRQSLASYSRLDPSFTATKEVKSMVLEKLNALAGGIQT
jgi:hypothetical protein